MDSFSRCGKKVIPCDYLVADPGSCCVHHTLLRQYTHRYRTLIEGGSSVTRVKLHLELLPIVVYYADNPVENNY